ncbi:MAG: hypothetical protein IJH09_03095 [Clostridia bacterium]|nr:hypothetical protein [Clostridia bacterium]
MISITARTHRRPRNVLRVGGSAALASGGCARAGRTCAKAQRRDCCKLDVQISADDILAAYGLEKGGRVQRFLDQKIIDDCTPYVPARGATSQSAGLCRGIFAHRAKTADPSGTAALPDRTLEFSAQVSTEIGSGKIIWNTPYAHYQYVGIVYVRTAAHAIYCGSAAAPRASFGCQRGLVATRRRIYNQYFARNAAPRRDCYRPNIPIIEPETGVLLGFFSPPGKKKHPTDKRLTYDTAQNPLAGSYWFERAKADHLNEWLDETRRVMIQN